MYDGRDSRQEGDSIRELIRCWLNNWSLWWRLKYSRCHFTPWPSFRHGRKCLSLTQHKSVIFFRLTGFVHLFMYDHSHGSCNTVHWACAVTRGYKTHVMNLINGIWFTSVLSPSKYSCMPIIVRQCWRVQWWLVMRDPVTRALTNVCNVPHTCPA